MTWDEQSRAARKVLNMVHELHLRGYQLLRIAPGMAPSGMHWRCSVTPAANTLRNHGARLLDFNRLTAHYSSAHERRYFGWEGVSHVTPSKLADRFLKELPEIAAAGHGRDWIYVGWYVEMLGVTYPDSFPIAYWEGPINEPYLRTIGRRDGVRVPMPPPGLAEAQEEAR